MKCEKGLEELQASLSIFNFIFDQVKSLRMKCMHRHHQKGRSALRYTILGGIIFRMSNFIYADDFSLLENTK